MLSLGIEERQHPSWMSDMEPDSRRGRSRLCLYSHDTGRDALVERAPTLSLRCKVAAVLCRNALVDFEIDHCLLVSTSTSAETCLCVFIAMDVCTESSAAICLKECLCQREPVFRARQVHCVEVEDEPSHPELFRTPWVRVYAGILATGNCTLYHRHRRDTLYLTLRDACLWNEFFVDPSLRDARTEVYRHDAKRFEVFGRWHARDRTPLVHRVCYRREDTEQGPTTSESASPTSLFIGIEFLEYPSAFCEHLADSVQSIEAVAERIPEPVCDRMRLWCLHKGVSALQLPFPGILVDWHTPLDERWNTTDIVYLAALTKERVRLFQAGEDMHDLVAGTLVVELRPQMETAEAVLPNQA